MKGILTDENGDIMVQNGSLIIGNNAADCVQRTLEAYKGEIKAQPLLGCNVRSMLNGAPDPFWRSDTNRQLQSQGINAEVNFIENGIEVRIN
jgi:hypothetical protein